MKILLRKKYFCFWYCHHHHPPQPLPIAKSSSLSFFTIIIVVVVIIIIVVVVVVVVVVLLSSSSSSSASSLALFIIVIIIFFIFFVTIDHLFGLVVWASAPTVAHLGSNPACAGVLYGSSHTSGLKIGTPEATLPGAWRYRFNVGAGWPGVSILWLGQRKSLICNSYLSVAARSLVWTDPSLSYTNMLLGR